MKENRAALIEKRLRDAFSPSRLEVLDESDQHVGHAGYQGGARHFSIVIAADCFNDLSRVKAHRLIYDLFSDMMPDQIHALRIRVL